MNGKIKWFSKEKGYGFIIGRGILEDIFFHISEYGSNTILQENDRVSFDIGTGKDDRKVAKNIRFISRGPDNCSSKPYYGKKTTTKDHEISGALVGAAIGSAGGPIGLIVGAIIGAIAGSPQEISSTCLKCGGTGHVTAIDGDFIGFQCERCKSFWKKRNKNNLSLDKLRR